MICIERFADYFVPNPRVELPERDVFGVLHGTAYEPTYGPEQGKTALAGCEFDMKSGEATVFHSLLESILDFRLMLSPFVIEVRFHYPMTLEEKVLRRLGWGERLRKSDVATIDRVVTLQRRDTLALHLHAVSVKPEELLPDDKVKRRHERERLYAESRGATWETVGSEWHRKFTSRNLAFIRSCCLDSNVSALYDDAVEFARRIKRSEARGSRDRRISLVAGRMNYSSLDGYRLFGAAICTGLLAVDDDYRLDPAYPLRLLEKGDAGRHRHH